MDPYGPKPARLRAVAADPVLPLARLAALGVTEAQLATIQATFDGLDAEGKRAAVEAMTDGRRSDLLAQLGLARPASVGGSLQGTPDGAGKARKAAKKTAAKKVARG